MSGLDALKRVGWLALKDPLLVTREGLIIDGYARKEYADNLGISTLPCVEIDADREEALRFILNKHRRSPGWNDYNRIRMASRLKEGLPMRYANQEFLALLTPHIPDRYSNSMRYFGLLAPRSRSLLPVVFDLLQQKMPAKPARLGYAQDLYRTFGTNPLIGREGNLLEWVGHVEPVLSI